MTGLEQRRRPGGGGVGPVGTPSSYASPAEPAITVHIEPGPSGDGFDVRINGTGDTDHDRSFSTYREARGWAGGLRMVKAWVVVDHCAEGRRDG